jgi:hypothetical protein
MKSACWTKSTNSNGFGVFTDFVAPPTVTTFKIAPIRVKVLKHVDITGVIASEGGVFCATNSNHF